MLRLTLLLVLASVTTLLLADTIHLEGGGKIEGTIIAEDEESYTVKTKFGEVKVLKANVVRIERGSNEEVFQRRLKELRDDDVEGHYELGLWAKEVGLKEKAKERFEYVLKLDPDHEGARKELGYKKVGNRWVSEEEYYKEKGYVKYKGEWMPKEDAEKLKKGYVRVGDEWMKKEDFEKIKSGYRRLGKKWVTEEEYYRAKGYVKYKGKWMRPEKAERLKKKEEEEKRKRELKRLEKLVKAKLKVRISFVQNATKEQMKRFAETVRKAADLLWDITGCGIIIKKAEIYDRANDGDIIIDNNEGKTVTSQGKSVSAYMQGEEFHTAGGCTEMTLLQGILAVKLGIKWHTGSDNCLQNTAESGKYVKKVLCNSCWQQLLQKYPGLKKSPPKEGSDFGSPPKVEILIKDN